ncbi:MAG: hypothetical protein QW035_00355 [Candidatus Anstonellales archaeon]
MGLIDELFGKQEKKVDAEQNPFRVATRFVPLKLYAKQRSRTTLFIGVKNNTKDEQLISIDMFMPSGTSGVGFDATGLTKKREIKVGKIKGGEMKEVSVDIFSNGQAQAKPCDIEMIVYLHYLDYDKVLRYLKKVERVQVV